MFYQHSETIPYLKPDKTVIIILLNTENPLLSGYISNDNLEILKQSVPFKIKGFHLVIFLFTDNTNFRAFWYGTNRLLMNAIYMSIKCEYKSIFIF